MDYHYVEPEDKPKIPLPGKKDSLSFLKKFSPILAVSILLPVFLFFLYNPPNVSFTSRASGTPELRLWFEPSNVTVTKGKTYDIQVYASIDNKSEFAVESLSFDVSTTPGVTSDRVTYSFSLPFSNEQMLGTISVSATGTGDQKLVINEESVKFKPLSHDIEIIVSPANIYVK
ncbi:hypothetical protein ACFL2C_01525 [Patescibacteria group bacterium]